MERYDNNGYGAVQAMLEHGFKRVKYVRVFQNGALRRIFEPKREEEARGWRRLHNEELHNLYASLNIIRTIKSRRMRRAGHVAQS
jgi:hypothetical protein